MRILFGPAAAVAARCEAEPPDRAILFVSPGRAVPDLPPGLPRLVLACHDVPAERPGFLAPTRALAADLLAFAAGAGTVAVGCEMGISRSTAAAVILGSWDRPDLAETAVAARLRALSPCATPNPLLIAWGDALLGRDGRLSAAVAAIGRGAAYRPPGLAIWDGAA